MQCTHYYPIIFCLLYIVSAPGNDYAQIVHEDDGSTVIQNTSTCFHSALRITERNLSTYLTQKLLKYGITTIINIPNTSIERSTALSTNNQSFRKTNTNNQQALRYSNESALLHCIYKVADKNTPLNNYNSTSISLSNARSNNHTNSSSSSSSNYNDLQHLLISAWWIGWNGDFLNQLSNSSYHFSCSGRFLWYIGSDSYTDITNNDTNNNTIDKQSLKQTLVIGFGTLLGNECKTTYPAVSSLSTESKNKTRYGAMYQVIEIAFPEYINDPHIRPITKLTKFFIEDTLLQKNTNSSNPPNNILSSPSPIPSLHIGPVIQTEMDNITQYIQNQSTTPTTLSQKDILNHIELQSMFDNGRKEVDKARSQLIIQEIPFDTTADTSSISPSSLRYFIREAYTVVNDEDDEEADNIQTPRSLSINDNTSFLPTTPVILGASTNLFSRSSSSSSSSSVAILYGSRPRTRYTLITALRDIYSKIVVSPDQALGLSGHLLWFTDYKRANYDEIITITYTKGYEYEYIQYYF